MPKVGGKKFAYTSAGKRKATAHARRTGQKVKMNGKAKKKAY